MLRRALPEQNPSGVIRKILKNRQTEIFLIFVIIAVRKLGGKNIARFTHLRTFKEKRSEI